MELPPKFWFQLERLKKALRSAFGSPEQKYDTSHRMCPNCRALIERNASVCPFCGEKLRSPRARSSSGTPGRIMGIIPIPSTATSAIVAVTIALYGISWYMTATSGAMQAMGGISGEVLWRLGAKSPAIREGQWWRLVTAIFLHAGLFHIGMNLWCLFDLGPEVESLFSTAKFVVFYLVTGVLGFVLSLWWRPMGMSIGASGAVCGLIGVLIGASFHHGHLGKAYRGQLWRWMIYIAIFGIFLPIDNAAHFGGLASGLLLGYVVSEGDAETQASQNLWNVLAVFSVVIIAGSFALMALQLGQPVR